MNYQVGDLFCCSCNKNHLYLLTEIPVENVYVITCMRTYEDYGYGKRGLDSFFKKVNK